MKETLRIVTPDGKVLGATRYIPETPNGKIVLINSATGVLQRYYADFAAFLSRQGFYAYTYDYRGIGESRYNSLRGFNATMKDWGTWDYHTMLQNIFQTHRNAKVIVIGHSVGGQLVGLSTLTTKVESVVMVGSQTPFIKNYRGIFQQMKLQYFWNFLIPVSTWLFGYFPARIFGLFEDLPAGVARQWAAWANDKNYLFGQHPEEEKKFRDLQQLALMVSFTDDTLAPPLAVKDLMQFYPGLKWSHWQIKPDDILQKQIGHFGFFKKKMEPSLWREVIEWMQKPLQLRESQAA